MHHDFAVLFTVASIVATLIAVYLSVMNNYYKFDVHAEEHKFLLGSYQHIAQKARVVDWPDMGDDDLVYTLRSLEESFQLLKARGTEPDDIDFKEAHRIRSEIRGEPDARIAQSFQIKGLDTKDGN
ncbi:MAG: hypothetical protein IPK78_04155 [Rhodospirillales bacterium]|nr:hypothetical protein [Rhodospirillales bacterium]